MLTIDVFCKGTSPLLLNRMAEAVLASLWKGGAGGKKRGKSAATPFATPREEAASKIYISPDGHPIVPATNLLGCLIGAGQHVRLDGKRQVSTAKSTVLPGFLWLAEPFVELVDPDDVTKAATWEVDMRQGRNPNGGEAVCLVRPRFDRWAFAVQIALNPDVANETIARELFDIGGRAVGLGDFRPARKGYFGQFIVERWTRVAQDGATVQAAE